ncbi:hypothetical protein TIFTF001_012327 [Ficus carica]|uniref:Uncharacterized protein n=1 Tax=Ficus carica TaxID=3494 RepID=A0AA88DI21_FICCA|nr:hypothetical protein TIFTF001_012327 [Ficus carica]
MPRTTRSSLEAEFGDAEKRADRELREENVGRKYEVELRIGKIRGLSGLREKRDRGSDGGTRFRRQSVEESAISVARHQHWIGTLRRSTGPLEICVF